MTMIADIKLTVAPPWCDGVGLDIAARQGQDDATEGNGHMPADWISDNSVYLASYDAGYAGGLALVAKLNGEAQSEGDFMAATLTAMRAGKYPLPMSMMPDDNDDVMRDERIGEYEYLNRGVW